MISAPAAAGPALRQSAKEPAAFDNPSSARQALRASARDPAQPFALAVAAFLLFALLRGGSSADALAVVLVNFCAIPVLAIALWRLFERRSLDGARWPGLVLLGAFALGLLQLVPMPPAIWTAFPGRGIAAAGYAAASMAPPWLPLSLTPTATWSAMTGLIAPAAVFTALLTVNSEGRRWVIAAALLGAIASILLGGLQMAGGAASPWRLYAFTDATAAVGVFANRNHQGVFLAAILPLAALVATAGRGGRGPPRAVWITLGFGLALLIVVGVAAAKSRAGVLLASPGALGAVLVALRRGDGRGRQWLAAASLLAATLGAVALVLAFNFTPLASRFAASLDDDLRSQLIPMVLDAAKQFAPVGAGLGSFQSIYPMFERPEMVTGVFVNHAHNDYAELWLEAGVPGLALVCAFGLWWLLRTFGLLRSAGRQDIAPRLAGSVIVGLLMTHACVDYPLRTPALAVLFALGCGLMVSPAAIGRLALNDRIR